MNDLRDDSLSGPLPIGVPVWVHATALGGMFLLILLLIGITTAFQGENIWNGWTEARELRHPGYAETIHINDVFRTRANTWSRRLRCLMPARRGWIANRVSHQRSLMPSR